MRPPLAIICICAILSVGMKGAGEKGDDHWTTYRCEKFGYEISYPPETELAVYFEGSSGVLKDAKTKATLFDFEVWPPDECIKPKGLTAKEIGIQRAEDVTQADSHGSSSYCGAPVTVHELASLNGIKIYELGLTCVSETIPGLDDDEMDAEQGSEPIEAEATITQEGKKWPTYFADISQPWIRQVLMLDPMGNDPRSVEKKDRTDVAIIRTILAKLKRFSIPKPPGVCIDDLPNPSTGIGVR